MKNNVGVLFGKYAIFRVFVMLNITKKSIVKLLQRFTRQFRQKYVSLGKYIIVVSCAPSRNRLEICYFNRLSLPSERMSAGKRKEGRRERNLLRVLNRVMISLYGRKVSGKCN